jgi:hypothetical protein
MSEVLAGARRNIPLWIDVVEGRQARFDSPRCQQRVRSNSRDEFEQPERFARAYIEPLRAKAFGVQDT